jgi:HD-GYP domain-containing protein (c-di-GMP phosphodiesterase class II)
MWQLMAKWNAQRRIPMDTSVPVAQPPTASRRWRFAQVSLVFVAVVVVCSYLDLTGQAGFDWLEQYAYDMRMVMHSQRNLSSGTQARRNIVLVTISDDTFAQAPFKALHGPPVPRDFHAKVIRELSQAGAKVIAFDLVFDIPRAEDKEMAAAVKEAARQQHPTKVLWASLFEDKQQVLPNATLRAASKYYGNILVAESSAHPAVDRIQAFAPVGLHGPDVPAFSLKAALMARGLENQPLRQIAGRWQAGNIIIPVDARGNFRISYQGKTEKSDNVFTIVPYEEVYNGELTKNSFYRQRDFFRDKIVVIGDTTKVGNDFLNTPSGDKAPAELHAHAIATLLQGNSFRAVPYWVKLAALCMLSVMICVLAAARRLTWMVLTSGALAISYFLFNVWLFVDYGIMLHLVGPTAALALATVGVLIERGLMQERERERMFDSLVMAAASAIEVRDPSTSGHSRRVTAMTIGLARAVSETTEGAFKRVRFTAAEMRELSYASMLHDFGKIGVRESVLTKAHKLEPFHFQVVKDRLLLCRRALAHECEQRKVALLLEYPREQAEPMLAELDRALHVQSQDIDTVMVLLEQANDPSMTQLPDQEYNRLQQTLMHLTHLTYEDETGTMQPVLTPAEKAALSIRKGSLTPDELQQIRHHASMSYDFLKQIPWADGLKNIPHIAHCHHERLNGEGYPRGILAPEIPLQARIMTVADIYDALTASDRPYKRAMPVQRSLELLQSEAAHGSLDAELVALFISREIYKLNDQCHEVVAIADLIEPETIESETMSRANPEVPTIADWVSVH